MPLLRPRLAPLFILAACACQPAADPAPAPRGPAPALTAPAPTLRRLTQVQYVNTIDDLLGEGLLLPTALEPDTAVSGLSSVGASVTAISPFGVEQYEDAAYLLAEQVAANPERLAATMGCDPAMDGCLATFVASFGRRAFRRTLTDEEAARVVAVGELAAATLGDTPSGVVYALAALLQSPHFLYREELGEPDPGDPTGDPDDSSGRRFTSVEMASRLSFFLWNTTPDEELLSAGEAGDLVTDAGLAAQVDRLLTDARAQEGVRTLFTEMLRLDQLDDLSKDPTVFLHMGPEVGPSAREETLLGIDALVFTEAGDYRDFFTTRRTFLDPVLAAMYNVQAPAMDGFAETTLSADDGRAGFLGQASFLALSAHPTSSSATLRGEFIREILLCQTIPPPPADVDTSIPAPTEAAPTLRDRVAVHLTDPTCAGCHQLTDPLGLGLENFDGLGMWRLTENGGTIDPTGQLDGADFTDALGLGEVVADHGSLGPCLAETAYRYATGHSVTDGEDALVDWHATGFSEKDFRVVDLLSDISMSPGFRRVGEIE